MGKLSNLEKRVDKLEKELAALKRGDSTPATHSVTEKKGKKGKKSKKNKTQKKGKRKINKYFQMMLEAKKGGKPSFVYNGHTYKGTKHPRLGMVYKKG